MEIDVGGLPADRIRGLVEANPSVDLRSHDLLTGQGDDAIDWGDLDPHAVRPAVLAYQRLARLGLDPETSERLIGRGLDSANRIAKMSKRSFVGDHAHAVGVDPERAARLHERAVSVRSKTFHLWANVAGTVASPHTTASPADTFSTAAQEVFQQLPSYQELFGSLDHCRCEECRSIFGPAAYLVDLLRIIDEHVTRPNAASIPPGLTFADRRPDIGAIPLSCDATLTTVPYLQIVNDRLLATAAVGLGVSPGAVLQQIARAASVHPRQLPFNQPLDAVTTLLDQVGAPYGAVLHAWGVDATVVAARSLGLSPEQQGIVTTPSTTDAEVAPFFGVTPADVPTLSEVDVFLVQADLDRAGLLDLIDQDLSEAERAAGLQVAFFINQALAPGTYVHLTAGDPSPATLSNLTAPALDGVNRLLRLADALAVPPTEVDWLLRSVEAGAPPAVDDAALRDLWSLRQLAAGLGQPLLAVAVLLGPLKTYGGFGGVGASQFDQLFNSPSLVATSGTYRPSGNPLNPGYQDAPLAWTPGSTTGADIAALTRVLPGLGSTAGDVALLGAALYGAAPTTLTVTTLSELYRHARLADWLQLPMGQYVRFLHLHQLAVPASPTTAELGRMVESARWLRTTGLDVYQLEYIVEGTPSVAVDLRYDVGSVKPWLVALQAVVGDPAAPTVAAQITAQVASLFGAGATETAPALAMAVAAVALPPGSGPWEQAFLARDGGDPAHLPYVEDVLAWVSRRLVMTAALSLSVGTLANLAAAPGSYGVAATFTDQPLASVQALSAVRRIMRTYGDQQQKLLDYVRLDTGGPPTAAQLAVLQQATGWDPAVAQQLLDGPAQAVTPVVRQLVAMEEQIGLMDRLAAAPGLMGAIADLATTPATAWSSYTAARQMVVAQTATAYGDGWASVREGIDGSLGVRQRDAVLALVLTQLRAQYEGIDSDRSVEELLLTNVEIGPETLTSLVQEALAACQLYLQRCRLRLERGVEELEIGANWWQWMMSYRTWQANREIFVYPENYLVPNLRRNVTPPFAALERSLRQSSITPANVDSAFRELIGGFADASTLTPVEAYRTIVDGTPTTYLIGRSATRPYAFSLASQPEGMPWSPWEKIDLTIGSSSATPVHAFGRLFLFWSELKRTTVTTVAGDAQKVSSENSIVHKLTLSYSFVDQQGRWVHPQVLVADEPVSYDGPVDIALAADPAFAGTLDPENPGWHAVSVLATTAENFAVAPSTLPDGECLVVVYGPMLHATGASIDVDGNEPPATQDDNARRVSESLRRAALDHNRVVDGHLSGNLPLRRAVVIDSSLSVCALVDESEFLLFDPCGPTNDMRLIRAEMQTGNAAVQIVPSSEPLTTDFVGDSVALLAAGSGASTLDGNAFIGPGIDATMSSAVFAALRTHVIDATGHVVEAALATLDLDLELESVVTSNPPFGPALFDDVRRTLFAHLAGTVLFARPPSGSAGVVPLQNQPGWFLLTLDAEVFLLAPEPVGGSSRSPFDPLDQAVVIGPPPLHPLSFVLPGGGVSVATSVAVFAALATAGLVVDGQLVAGTSQAAVAAALGALISSGAPTNAQVPGIFHALTSAPIVYPHAFVPVGIPASVSETVFTTLQNFSIVDPDGRIDETILTGANVQIALAVWVQAGTVTWEQVSAIYSVLADTPRPISLRYANTVPGGSTHTGDLRFRVIRTTTAAVAKLSRALFAGGPDLLLGLGTQSVPVTPVLPFDRFGPSTTNLIWPEAIDATQVDFDGLYGQYFWEIFFHAPRLVASSLTGNQQFEEAQRWLQFVFDPTVPEEFVTDQVIAAQITGISAADATAIVGALKAHDLASGKPILDPAGAVAPGFDATVDMTFLRTTVPTLTATQLTMIRNVLLNFRLSAPASHYWQFLPFRNHTLQSLADQLSDDNPAVKIYDDDPFDPFAIARLRIGAFEKATVMQYIDNLVAWGDVLFTQNTRETIDAAYLLYVYAADLLGPAPQVVGDCAGSGTVLTFDEIKAADPGGIPQFLIDLEHVVGTTGTSTLAGPGDHAFNDLDVYFCVPENEQFAGMWRTVADRMHKIQHSQDIHGVSQQLALFAPPIDPLALVRAAAAGNVLDGVGQGGARQFSPYRFAVAVAQAQGLAQTLVGLGGSLLSVLERQDAEALAVLQTTQTAQILDMTTQIKQDAIDQLAQTLTSLQAALDGADVRLMHYTTLLEKGLSSYEDVSLDAMAASLVFTVLANVTKTAAAIAYTVPQVGSPFAMTYGGIQVGSTLSAASEAFEIGASISNYVSQRSATMGGYERRSEDWTLQRSDARYSVAQLTSQVAAAETQLDMARQDLAVHLTTIQQNQKVADYFAGKFTNEELYGWMAGQTSSIYYQTFGLCLQAARWAQASYQVETDQEGRSFLDVGCWSDQRKGLLAGEGLRLALDTMESAYHQKDSRRLEIEKTISLAMLDPLALDALKTTGTCSFELPEALFDADYPGHYMRKIRTISVSIPAVLGPYDTIKATLEQTSNTVVTDPTSLDAVRFLLGLVTTPPKVGLRTDWLNQQCIAISRGVDDSGLFQLDFQDARYLPFENTGAVSKWTLTMPKQTNRLNFDLIPDVILTLRYTALSDGDLRTQVETMLAQVGEPGGLYIEAPRMQPDAWNAFVADHADPRHQSLLVHVEPDRLSTYTSLTYTTLLVRLTTADGVTIRTGASFLSLVAGPKTASFSLAGGVATEEGLTWDGTTLPTTWELRFDLTDPDVRVLLVDGFVDPGKLREVELVAVYDAKVDWSTSAGATGR